jgi:hypothetical protein
MPGVDGASSDAAGGSSPSVDGIEGGRPDAASLSVTAPAGIAKAPHDGHATGASPLSSATSSFTNVL